MIKCFGNNSRSKKKLNPVKEAIPVNAFKPTILS